METRHPTWFYAIFAGCALIFAISVAIFLANSTSDNGWRFTDRGLENLHSRERCWRENAAGGRESIICLDWSNGLVTTIPIRILRQRHPDVTSSADSGNPFADQPVTPTPDLSYAAFLRHEREVEAKRTGVVVVALCAVLLAASAAVFLRYKGAHKQGGQPQSDDRGERGRTPRSQRIVFGGLGVVVAAFPLVRAVRHSNSATINQCIALAGVVIAVGAVRSFRRRSDRRFTWPWLIGAGVVGAVALSTVAVLLFPQFGAVYSYGLTHAAVPENIAAHRLAFDLSSAAGGSLGSGLVYSAALCSLFFGFDLLDSRAPLEGRQHYRRSRS